MLFARPIGPGTAAWSCVFRNRPDPFHGRRVSLVLLGLADWVSCVYLGCLSLELRSFPLGSLLVGEESLRSRWCL